MERYNTYSDHLKKKYGEKVYKIPISLPVTCPNRDGSLSSEPCIFCGSIGADYETKAVGLPITRQLDRSIAHVGPKYKAKKFIAYFLNYTNTYAPPEDFRSWVEEAMAHPDVVGVDVSTRPDCVNERYLEILKESSEKYGKDVTVELGLQSSNAHTLLKLGRCHTAAILNQKSKIRFFPRLKDRHLHWGVEPVFPALHDRQMRPAFLTEALDHGAAGQGIPVTIQHLRAAMPVQRMFPHPAQIRP